MMRKLLFVFLVFIVAFSHVFTLNRAADAMKALPKEENHTFAIPAPFLKIAALEYRGLVSDIFFIKSMVFIGESQQRKEKPRVKEWEWRWWTGTLETSTDLDPYFFDAYYYANAFLPWDAHMTEEANRLLEKGIRYRDWDWMLPFFAGFNEFFFLQNDIKAAEFMMEASRRPGGDPMLASIAARLAYKTNRVETAILFLEESSKRAADTTVKKRYEIRIRALRSILFLDNAVSEFRKKFGRIPAGPEELVSRNIITEVPLDPYGGRYYITVDGRVRSTASSEIEPYLSPAMKARR